VVVVVVVATMMVMVVVVTIHEIKGDEGVHGEGYDELEVEGNEMDDKTKLNKFEQNINSHN